MWIAECVYPLIVKGNDFNQPYAVRSSRGFDYVSFFDDYDRAEREASAMNTLEIEEPALPTIFIHNEYTPE